MTEESVTEINETPFVKFHDPDKPDFRAGYQHAMREFYKALGCVPPVMEERCNACNEEHVCPAQLLKDYLQRLSMQSMAWEIVSKVCDCDSPVAFEASRLVREVEDFRNLAGEHLDCRGDDVYDDLERMLTRRTLAL